ncbi:hypothetical protein AtNW77_Chr5g0095081 [Arabidopsis thaliana]|uniref:Uncharacterized protein n=4 Tax=Arabidopsis TaxID=3701 RepID=A0A654G079_ARATH|nr:uncharacterized protein AT5G11416 [Arabidopsis thaliana]KAG7601922.1 hypothetical protein ISN45_At05g010460 [Arabidopsis thaliana x Arabidopsis arenosa]KAG7608872.1 hypothetical protein ISN44_As05g010440 [Arabidopsis suecica]AED91676.1 hypothetical protein AT5G11416 [Arabidopsis thaliana]CAA0401998.1 unnamed protein product [Arabidopsis thaliana]VYS66535.1 unnamed protein product [Arabidopsis thaliana]|eukprot:NP_001119209.1 hypothetical protein AT5G11416 [Arabidopsis thaliana]
MREEEERGWGLFEKETAEIRETERLSYRRATVSHHPSLTCNTSFTISRAHDPTYTTYNKADTIYGSYIISFNDKFL